MLRYGNNYIDRKPMKGAIERSKKQHNNKNKIDNEVAYSVTIEKKNSIINNDDEISPEDLEYFRKIKNELKSQPKNWKDSWQRPINSSLSEEDYDIINESFINTDDKIKTNKKRTDKISLRQDSKKSQYMEYMIMNY
ncbi:hypothetical protein BCR32DRAFT_264451 [Anaeromyces robustus]|uniref:Uncharacterized protein n=1 Tax=Anaeromyces robustus TaxID=1754192 RepID=A0A1Y1XP50_9FUNG|nr:hypothetical protein BCR32DRAFT_289507 [Anaeromyces robustus]ORX87106.1 hypothetical protein BCR32DRAFT_264451 [Anaeromyces robustus]|eukprot:ORX87104.1 hypothetical protein BCR32DRAFT_289507 [Anaeromyces robustus]